jgi:hypothetical protein
MDQCLILTERQLKVRMSYSWTTGMLSGIGLSALYLLTSGLWIKLL